MELKTIYKNTLTGEPTITTATILSHNELVILLNNGDVNHLNFRENTYSHAFSMKSSFTFDDGGFDASAPSSIYTMDEIIVVVNDYKTHGKVYFPENYVLRLRREDYHADISEYPIALFKDSDGIPHLIYSQAWNHLQVMNIRTRQILTATKSLIEEGAEEKHLAYYSSHKEDNKLPWPQPYDYFFGELSVSPDARYFLSNGWAWGSFGHYVAFNIREFIYGNRIKPINIAIMDHQDRGMCWASNDTVAITCHPFLEEQEEDEEDKKGYPSDYYEIKLFKISDTAAETLPPIGINGIDITGAVIHYSSISAAYILHSKKIGVLVVSPDGKILFHDDTVVIDSYDEKTGLMLKISGKAISVYTFSQTIKPV
ncbi:hypothetical protein [Chitinophaga sp. Cy-1792]|uniref:hypothetical protein n=1 Tax=Chitinophaga sp. Cy-1792 TaxID=2608339 RepID=UPI001422859D|nr:hypothetical protein [Chitinophaga sp. Cy-1792]NIG54072.1 hypothetical protein [Chitinophaga sp. Cy-1792]